MLRVEIQSSINLIEEKLWNSIVSEREIFNSYRFIKAVEDAHVEESSYRYLLFYNGDELVGHTVLSSFVISLDLFIPGNKLVQLVKKILPSLFNVRILFSGLPASLGQLNLTIKSPEWQEAATEALQFEMDKLAHDHYINLLCVKEFKGWEKEMCKGLLHHDFFSAFSLPYMILEIQWKSFKEFLQSMRHQYRRSINLSSRKFCTPEPLIFHADDKIRANQPVLILGDTSICPPQRMHELYLAVMERTPTKLETLNRAFFENFYKQFADTLQILTVQHNDKIISAALLIQIGEELNFILVGRENHKDSFDSYFNLVYGIIKLAIQKGVKRINMGQTAYWVKQRVGATPVPVYIYFKSRKPLLNWILKKLNRQIFPELILKPIRVFKDRNKVMTEVPTLQNAEA